MKPAATLEATAGGLVVLPFTMAAASMVLLGAGVHPGAWPLGAGLAACATWLLCASSRRAALTAALAILVIVSVAWFAAGSLFDGSYDGLWYHQEAVLRLIDGWNPVRDSIVTEGADSVGVWLQHYPKAAWLIAASVVSAFDRIEPAKLFGLVLMVAAFCQAAVALLRLTPLGRRWAFLIAFLAAANPVAIYQAASFYVDGMLASCLTIATASAALAVAGRTWRPRLIGAAALCIAINLKYTGLLYGLVLVAVWVAAVTVSRGRREGVRAGVAAAGVVAFATFALGYASYGRNVIEHGNPFVPVAGSSGVRPDLMSNNLPANLVDANRLSRFVTATFSHTDGSYPPPPTRAKLPFTVDADELAAFEHYDVRVAGLGPLFGGLLLLSLVAPAAGFVSRGDARATMMLWIIGGLALGSVFLHSEGWWARYAPQAWLMPVAFAAGAAGIRNRFSAAMASALVVVALVNVVLVAGASLHFQLQYAGAVRASLQQMREASPDIHVSFGRFQSLRRRLHEAGIQYRDADAGAPEARRHPIPAIDRRMAYWYD